VTDLINACDAGREGELIFRYIVQHSGTEKGIRRLWLQSMTAQSIRDGFQNGILVEDLCQRCTFISRFDNKLRTMKVCT
jgi:DNA topoisomerase-3